MVRDGALDTRPGAAVVYTLRVRTVGVDLASGDRATAICRVDWSANEPRLERLWVGASDEDILGLRSHDEVVAIDAPFGWPVGFARAVAAYAEGAPWPPTQPPDLWARRTDEVAETRAGGAAAAVGVQRSDRPTDGTSGPPADASGPGSSGRARRFRWRA
jgi:hypothetical protein